MPVYSFDFYSAARQILLITWVFCVLIWFGPALSAQVTPWEELTAEDPSKIQTAEACGECHISEYEVWKKTTHATGFKTLHRRDDSAQIAERMGVSLIKRESPCLRCHFTTVEQRDQLRAVSGVSCESCHGAGADWIDVHNDYGGKGQDHTNETPEHRAQRLTESRALGMRRPSDLYPVVASCYGCHSVPYEELVNKGGHPAGSGDFELVARYGKIEHNFLQSFLTGDGTVSEAQSQEDKRLMYVTGRALEVETALRGVAEATEKGTYSSSMIRRVRLATNELRAIERRSQAPQISDILAILRQVRVGLNNRQALLQASDSIGDATRRFLAEFDGTTLADLDPLLRGEADDLPEDDTDDASVIEVADAAGSDSTATGGGTDGGTTTAGGQGAGPAAGVGSGGSPTTGGSGATAAVAAVGEVKRRIRPASNHDTVGPGTCTGCHRHSPQSEWWFEDAHYRAADRFFEEDPKAVRIARLYGIRPDRMSRGDQVCMDCHGTVVSGKERREVGDGVGCESCHGAAKDYLEPHQEGEPELGIQRPGYQAALKLGMKPLKDASARSATCSGCHYITEPRLISAGHPSGIEFDYLAGMGEIEHWEKDSLSDTALRTAFAGTLKQRGAVPKVRFARLAGSPTAGGGDASGAAPSTGASTSAAGGGAGSVAAPGGSGGNASASGPRRRSTLRGSSARAARTGRPVSGDSTLNLPPFPEIDEETSIEDVLLLLKQRLELLYQATSPEGESP